MKPDRVFGVDFSGGRDAGNKIWIAGGAIEGKTLKFDRCQQASTLPHSGRQRDQAIAALRTFVREMAPCVIGLDFPFGLPRLHVKEGRWEDFVLNFRDHQSAIAFQKVCHDETSASDPKRKELRRATDTMARTPFSPYNRRLYFQTFYGIRDFLAPLVEDQSVSVLPMQVADPDRSWLVEICPASTLKQMGLSQPYKGHEYAAVRGAILTALIQREDIVVPGWIHGEVKDDKEGDALDSIIAAVATHRAAREAIGVDEPDALSMIEGFVYV